MRYQIAACVSSTALIFAGKITPHLVACLCDFFFAYIDVDMLPKPAQIVKWFVRSILFPQKMNEIQNLPLLFGRQFAQLLEDLFFDRHEHRSG